MVSGAGAAWLTIGGARGSSGTPRVREYPFAAGVASGDPWPGGAVLWTRLTGAPPVAVRLRWQVAHDEAMTRVVADGLAVARPEDDHAVHVEVAGLRPGRDYWYRFYADGEASPTGRTRTASAHGASPAQLRFCFASCAQFEHGWFTAYRRIAEDDPAFLLHVGDYVYEYAPGGYPCPGGDVRHHDGGETWTLEEYRRRYAQYHTDPDLLEVRRLVPLVAVPDDHEVENNYAAGRPEEDFGVPQDPVAFARRRLAALQAYREWMPLRREQRRADGSLRLFRALAFGDLVDVVLADTRTFRSDQPCDDRYGTGCAGQDDPAATVLGTAQERWLLDRLALGRARWSLVAQQVQMAPRDLDPGDDQGYNLDTWDGYRQARARLLAGIAASGARNPVVLTGDVHHHYAADLHVSATDATSPVVAGELVATSVTSGGDGDDEPDETLAQNPWLRHHANRRGYVRCTVTREELRADFRVLPTVRTRGAPASTGATFVLHDGVRGLQPA
jgi:alkaline phosphatase D